MPDYALLFPGQGSQQVGMGKDLAEAFPEGRAVFQAADGVLGFGLSTLCFAGPLEALTETANAQPAVLTTSVACLRVLERELPEGLAPRVVAGHSLGEYTALVAAGSLTFADALRLVRERGRLMQAAGRASPGGMAAVIGSDQESVRRACEAVESETGLLLRVANDNCPGQVVVAGHDAALDRFQAAARQRGFKLVKRLAVSVACHTPLMRPAQAELNAVLDAVDVRPARVPVCANTDARWITSAEEIRRELRAQLCGPVEWARSIETIRAAGVTRFCEVGPGQVLTGLIRRIDGSVRCASFGAIGQLPEALGYLGARAAG